MKTPILTVAVAACLLAATAQAQKQSPSKKATLGTSQTKGAQQAATAGPSGAAAATLSQGSTFFVGPNDACLNATAIAGAGTYAFDIVGATTDGPTACGIFTNDVWYNFTATATGTYDVRTCGQAAFDTEIAVYNTAACPVGAAIVCNDDNCGLQSSLTFAATNTSVYKIRVGGYNGASGTGNIVISLLPPPPPPSPDLCGSAMALVGAGPHPFNNLVATTGAEGQTNANCTFFGTPGIDNDVWFTWTAGASGNATLSMCAWVTGLDTKVAVYDGTACPTVAAIACNDDSCGLITELSFCAVNTQQYLIQVGNFPGAIAGSGSFTIIVTPPGAGNDECGGATALAPTGPYAFDNSLASTGCAGQSNSNCVFFGLQGVENDLWYTWTATATGLASITTCNTTTIDSKIALYQGAGCPTGQAIACNDDACGLQSSLCANVTSGQTYTIQLGTFPGAAGGPGTFDITVAAGGSPCQIDDGSSEDILGFTAGGELAWIQRFGPSSGSTGLTNVQISWGSLAAAGFSPPNGTAAKVLLYEDPNDDGDPSDAVLVQQINTTVTNVDTDMFNTYPVTPVSMSGYFFVGAGLIHGAGQLVAPMDLGCPQPLSYLFGDNTGAAVNYGTPSANPFPPTSFASNGFPCNLMVRAGCTSSPMLQNCFPGQSGVIACPCGNPPAGTGLGCNNFGAGPADSGTLTATGVASLASDTIVLVATGENNTSTTVFWTGKNPKSATGIPAGAGVRCVTQNLKRLYNHQASGGTVTAPIGADLSVSARTAVVYGVAIAPGETRKYFNIYRDPQAAGPCGSSSSTINLTNAGSITWAP